jgi:hypothetical protein
LNSAATRELKMLTNIQNSINLSQTLLAQDTMERNQILNELLARPIFDYEEDFKIINSRSYMQLEVIKATNSKMEETKEDVQSLINNQNQEYNTLNSLITVVNEFHLMTIKDREARDRLLKDIFTKPTSNYKRDFEGIGTLIRNFVPHKLIDNG